jgi:hypothetical protein
MAASQHITGNDWSVAGNWSSGAVPASNEVVIVPEDALCNTDITGGLDQGGKDYDLLKTHEGYTHSVGGSASPLKAAADLILCRCRGGFYFECSKDGVNALKVDECRVQSAIPNAITELGSESGDAGEWDKIIVDRGHVTLKANILFGASAIVEIGYITSKLTDATVTIVEGADTLPTLEINGGRCEASNVVTTARVIAGLLQKKVSPITTLDIFDGGRVEWYDETVAADGVTIKVHAGGTLDLTKTARADTGAATKVISTLWTFPGSTLIYDPKVHTFTTDNNLGGNRITV